MLHLLISLVILGAILYLIDLIPMDATIRRVIQVLAVVFVIIYVLQILFGLVLPMPLR
jgi:heme A synthase